MRMGLSIRHRQARSIDSDQGRELDRHVWGEGAGTDLHAQKTADWVGVGGTDARHEAFTVSKQAPIEAGTALVEAIVKGLPPGIELDERETALLNLAARQADDIASLERDIEERGVRVPGSRDGHTVLNPAISEARQGRLALGKLLGALELPESASDATRRAQRAAEARWRQAS
jgi:hypothetical protein